MGFLVGFLFLAATWLTILTKKTREHTIKNKVLEIRNRDQVMLLNKLKHKLYAQNQKIKEIETGKAGHDDGNDSTTSATSPRR
jgi:hypothetical protein